MGRANGSRNARPMTGSAKPIDGFAAVMGIASLNPSYGSSSVEEIANMVVYVASPQASATNGAALRAEGGIVQTIA